MEWKGVYNALLNKNEKELFREAIKGRDPDEPYNANTLQTAIDNLTLDECREVYEWADRWLRNSFNDCLRARGDVKWLIMSSVKNQTKSRLFPIKGSEAYDA